MRSLTLVRHAKSSWDYADLSDFERPLNARGRRDAPVMAQRLVRLGHAPELVVSSPALRAITTAHVFCEALAVPVDSIEVRPRIYDASPQTLLEVIRGLDDQACHVLMFGHNPGFTELAHALAHCGFDDMPTCAMAGIELQVEHWKEVAPGCGRLSWFLYPKDGGN